MYLCFSIGVIWGNIDYFIFNNEKFLFSNYIIISTSLLRIFLLIVAIFPNNKIHLLIYKKSKKAIIFVVIYSLFFGIFENIFKFQNILVNKRVFFIFYNILLIFIYLYIFIKLIKLSKSDNFVFKYFSISILLLALKSIYTIYGIFYISFDIKLISVAITSLFLIIIIIAAGVELYSTVNNYNLLNNGVASGKCGFHTLRAFSPLIPMVCRLFTNYSYTLSIIYNKLFSLTLKSPLLLYYL